jgi:hypothetical protein
VAFGVQRSAFNAHLAQGAVRIEARASDLVGTRSRANLGRAFDGDIRSNASDRMRAPAQHSRAST